jgi:MFS family permease
MLITKYRELSTRKLSALGWLICCLVSLFYCYEYLLRMLPGVMVPSLMQNFAVTATGLGWLTNAYNIGYTPLQLVVGPLIDYYGSRRMLILAILTCVVGSMVFASTQDIWVAATGRLLIGIGSAFAFVGVLRLASNWLSNEHFSVFVGITTSLAMMGAMVGDVELTHMVTTLGYLKVIYLLTFLGCLLVPLFLLFIYEKSTVVGEERKVNQVFFQQIKRVCLNPKVIVAGVMGSFLFLSLQLYADVWGISYLHDTCSITKSASGALNSMVYFGWLVGAPLSGIFSELFSTRKWIVSIGALLAALTFSLVLYFRFTSTCFLYPELFFFGLFCSVEVLCFVMAKDSVGEKVTATALGVVNFLVMLGGTILVPIASWILDKTWLGHVQHGIRIYTISNFQSALTIIPVALLITAVIAAFYPETYPDEEA